MTKLEQLKKEHKIVDNACKEVMPILMVNLPNYSDTWVRLDNIRENLENLIYEEERREL